MASLGTIEFLPFILFSLPIPLGSIVGGIVATALGLRTALFVGALGAFLAVIPLVITPVRTLREMPTPAEDT